LENTAEFILSRTAPIFNKNGYVGTSLSDLTKATGLTKGAIYGNFLNKEDLALKAFQWNLKEAILNVGLDSKFINPLLYKAAKKVSRQFVDGLVRILKDGKTKGVFNKKVNPIETAKNILSMIEGSTFMALTHNDNDYIVHAMDFIDNTIVEGIKK